MSVDLIMRPLEMKRSPTFDAKFEIELKKISLEHGVSSLQLSPLHHNVHSRATSSHIVVNLTNRMPPTLPYKITRMKDSSNIHNLKRRKVDFDSYSTPSTQGKHHDAESTQGRSRDKEAIHSIVHNWTKIWYHVYIWGTAKCQITIHTQPQSQSRFFFKKNWPTTMIDS